MKRFLKKLLVARNLFFLQISGSPTEYGAVDRREAGQETLPESHLDEPNRSNRIQTHLTLLVASLLLVEVVRPGAPSSVRSLLVKIEKVAIEEVYAI